MIYASNLTEILSKNYYFHDMAQDHSFRKQKIVEEGLLPCDPDMILDTRDTVSGMADSPFKTVCAAS